MIKRLAYYLPIPTIRCLTLSAFIGILYFSLTKEVDLVAGSISAGLLILTLIIYFSLICTILRNRKSTFSLYGQPEVNVGNYKLTVTPSRFKNFPFITIEYKVIFHTKYLNSWDNSTTQIGEVKEVIFNNELLLPAVYQINKITLTYSDIIGLFYYKKDLNRPFTFKAYPISNPYTEEIISSYTTAGDTSYDKKSVMGDYYEFKPYHPSDGTKLIIWKTYARTGELVARAPEFSSNPSGSVLCYLACGNNPELFKTSLGLFERIEFLDLDINYLIEGSDQVTNNQNDFKEELIKNTWNCIDNIHNETESLSLLLEQVDLENLKSLIIIYNKKLNPKFTMKIERIIESLRKRNIIVSEQHE